tara:strand:- start:108 stop:290 length:183 start_codon:yes stop_codon:yes gene_type:complete
MHTIWKETEPSDQDLNQWDWLVVSLVEWLQKKKMIVLQEKQKTHKGMWIDEFDDEKFVDV